MRDELTKLLLSDVGPAHDGLRPLADGSERYQRILTSISQMLRDRTHAKSVETYSVGFEAGYLTLVASLPGHRAIPKQISIQDPDFNVTRKLNRSHPKQYLNSVRLPELIEVTSDRSEVLIWLFGRGEFFGFIRLAAEQEFSTGILDDLRNMAAQLLRVIAEENFAFRMNIMIEPFDKSSADATIFPPKAVVQQLTRSFGADGSTLRMAEDGVLTVEASYGLVNAAISAPRQPGDLVSGKIFANLTTDWAAVVTDDSDYYLGGARVSAEDARSLREAGISSLVIGCLTRRQGSLPPERVGTLSYYFFRPHYFSERDLMLFRACLRRVSDALSISSSVEEIRAQAALLESQSRRMTYVEVANLLAHDLWHKSTAVFFNARSYLDFVRTVIRQEKLRGSETTLSDLQQEANTLVESATTLYQTSTSLHSLQAKPNEEAFEKTDFSVADVVDYVLSTLKPALDQQKISPRISIPASLQIHGAKFLFEQVIFNLVINTIDAAKSRTKPRPMALEINAHVQQGRVIVRYSDEGPGIDPFNFPNEQDVFIIGKTSKKTGTGTGLPIARQLIGSHFGGNLTLFGRRPALFTIDLPLR